MKTGAQVVVVGGGVVGASVLYHLTKAGWTDVVLVERTELTAGSTWHSAGGMHTLNGDPNVARLQRYTIELYAEIERISGQDCGIHMPGGVMLADTPESLDWLKMTHARGRYLGMETELVSVAEAVELVPLIDTSALRGRPGRRPRGPRRPGRGDPCLRPGGPDSRVPRCTATAGPGPSSDVATEVGGCWSTTPPAARISAPSTASTW